MITYPFASAISSLGSVPVCRYCSVDSTAQHCVGVSCCQSNCDFAYCPDAIQKTDSEMSEQGDECKPEQPSVPLQLNVVKYSEWPTQTMTMRLPHRWKGRRIIKCGVPPCRHNNPRHQQVVVSRGDETCVSPGNRAQMTRSAGVVDKPNDQGNKHNS